MGKKSIAQKVMKHRKEKMQKIKGGSRHITANNPFEVRVNRSKSNVLGRKGKEEKGLPGISRSKAIKKRKRTLLQEYKVKDKANAFIDKRFGEFDEDMPLEEKLLKRFALSRQQHHKKPGTYNLDDEDLTHLGQSLAQMESFSDDEMLKESEDERDDGEAETHFGNLPGKLSKKQESEKPKTRKQIVEEIIAQSKKTKYERQQVHEETVSQTEDLDSAFKDIIKLLGKKEEKDDAPVAKANDYDVLVNTLKFEGRAKAGERTKSKEEQEEERKRKIKQQEEERTKRMKLPSKEERKIESVDSIVELSNTKVDKRFELRFKDGKMVMPEGVASLVGENQVNGKEDDTSDEEDMRENADAELCQSYGDETSGSPITVPGSLDELHEAIHTRSNKEKIEYVKKVTDHLMKYSEIDKNKKVMGFFTALLDHIDVLSQEEIVPVNILNKISGPIYNLAVSCPEYAFTTFQTKLRRSVKRFWRKSELSGHRVLLPTVREIILLKIIATVYPTSDIKHALTTPALTLMAAMLQKSSYKTPSDIAVGLLVSTLIYDYVNLSKRFVPEVIRFLSGVLWLSNKKQPTDSGAPIKCRKSDFNMLVPDSKDDVDEISLGDVVFRKNVKNLPSVKVSCIRTCLALASRFSKLYDSLPAHSEIFACCRDYITRFKESNYPLEIQPLVTSTLIELSKKLGKERIPLTWLARKPVPLPLLEPKFMEVYEVRNDRRGGRGKSNEKQKLAYKYKKEMKGAIREIRKDTQFLAKEKLRETIDRDKERVRKVNELMRELGQQQGECKALDKVKKKASR